MFIQIDHVDGAGHHYGHMTPGYFKAVELADSLAGVIVKAAYFGNNGSQSAYTEGYFRVVQNINEITGVSYKLYKGKNWNKSPDFNTKSDDGSKLYVNGQQIVDNDGDHGVQEREGSINLESGKANAEIKSEKLN